MIAFKMRSRGEKFTYTHHTIYVYIYIYIYISIRMWMIKKLNVIVKVTTVLIYIGLRDR
jgi:hypothetical protein